VIDCQGYPDMMEIGNFCKDPPGKNKQCEDEERAHFGLWWVLLTPHSSVIAACCSLIAHCSLLLAPCSSLHLCSLLLAPCALLSSVSVSVANLQQLVARCIVSSPLVLGFNMSNKDQMDRVWPVNSHARNQPLLVTSR
jgi:hypothetical protein